MAKMEEDRKTTLANRFQIVLNKILVEPYPIRLMVLYRETDIYTEEELMDPEHTVFFYEAGINCIVNKTFKDFDIHVGEYISIQMVTKGWGIEEPEEINVDFYIDRRNEQGATASSGRFPCFNIMGDITEQKVGELDILEFKEFIKKTLEMPLTVEEKKPTSDTTEE